MPRGVFRNVQWRETNKIIINNLKYATVYAQMFSQRLISQPIRYLVFVIWPKFTKTHQQSAGHRLNLVAVYQYKLSVLKLY